MLPIAAPAQSAKTGTVTSVDVTGHKVSVTTEQTFSVLGTDAESKLGTLAKGDGVRFEANDKNEVQAGSVEKTNPFVHVPWLLRIVALVVVAFLLLLVAYLIAKLSCDTNIKAYFIGADNRISNTIRH